MPIDRINSPAAPPLTPPRFNVTPEMRWQVMKARIESAIGRLPGGWNVIAKTPDAASFEFRAISKDPVDVGPDGQPRHRVVDGAVTIRNGQPRVTVLPERSDF